MGSAPASTLDRCERSTADPEAELEISSPPRCVEAGKSFREHALCVSKEIEVFSLPEPTSGLIHCLSTKGMIPSSHPYRSGGLHSFSSLVSQPTFFQRWC